MTTIEENIKDNARENDHLRKLAERLSDDDLRIPMEAGWTVSAVLAHLAFWDQRAITLIEKWKQAGVSESAIDVDVVNEVTRRLCLAIQPRKAAELAITIADEIDQLIMDLNPEMVEAILTKGTTVKLNRADHRRTHLGEIEKVLQEKGS
jgi:7-keto-8-aminopelargonate synthetase-like enzyme